MVILFTGTDTQREGNEGLGKLALPDFKFYLQSYSNQNIVVSLEENTEEKLHEIGFGSDFLDMTPKAWATKKKTHFKKKLHFIKIKNFYALKDSIKRLKT